MTKNHPRFGPNNQRSTPSLERQLADAQAWLCFFCEQPMTYTHRRLAPTDVTVDHLHPRSRGGSNDRSNLVAACRACNLRKGARTVAEFLFDRIFSAVLSAEEVR